MAIKIQLRRDTSLNWTRNNPVLALGEPGLETDTSYVKYGDGSTTWNNLEYASPFLTNIISTSEIIEGSNLYFSNARVYANVISFGAARTSDLTTANVLELNNLYFSNDRAYANIFSSDLKYTDEKVFANVEQIGYASNNYVNNQLTNKVDTSSFNLSDLNDSILVGLTVDNLIQPAMARFSVINNGNTSYRFLNHYGTIENPNVHVISGTTVAFRILSEGHPFLIQESDLIAPFANVATNLIHSSNTGNVSLNFDAQGKDSGTLYWNVPFGTTNVYRYVCSVHGVMTGNINVKDIRFI